MFKHGSLCTGIGGFEEGAAQAGFENVFNAELDPFLNRHLKLAYPHAKQYGNLKTITATPHVTVLSAGFPCQDISCARGNKGDGLHGTKSSLFYEVMRIASLNLPDYILLENSPELLRGDLWDICHEITKIGYLCEWKCLRASDFGYPHRRNRIYIVAYPISIGLQMPVFQPRSVISLSKKWSPTEAYIRLSESLINPPPDTDPIRFNDVVPRFRDQIQAYGNSVMPAITEFIFKCIKLHIQNHQTK